MGFTDAVKSGFQKYFDFNTRACRSEFWFWNLFTISVALILGFIDGVTGLVLPTGIAIMSTIFKIAVIIPNLAIAFRRLHDRDMSGLWLLLVFVPILGTIALIVLFCLKGTEGDNRFGPDPLAEEAAPAA